MNIRIEVAKVTDMYLAYVEKAQKTERAYQAEEKRIREDYRPEKAQDMLAQAKGKRDLKIQTDRADIYVQLDESTEAIKKMLSEVVTDPVPAEFMQAVEVCDKIEASDTERRLMTDPFLNNYSVYRMISGRAAKIAAEGMQRLDKKYTPVTIDDALKKVDDFDKNIRTAVENPLGYQAVAIEADIDGFKKQYWEPLTAFSERRFSDAANLMKQR